VGLNSLKSLNLTNVYPNNNKNNNNNKKNNNNNKVKSKPLELRSQVKTFKMTRPRRQTVPIEDDIQEIFFSTLFQSIRDNYQRDIFCDVTLYAMSDDPDDQTGAQGLRGIHCHALVLCSVAPALKELLLVNAEETDIFLPDLNYDMVLIFIDAVYEGKSPRNIII
jgi:hypothetical protein